MKSMPAQKNALATHHSVHGFTLVELLVVVSIIGVLSTIGVTVFTGARQSAGNAKVKADIDAIRKAYEGKYDPVAGTYGILQPTDFSNGKIPTPDNTDNTSYIRVGSYATASNPTPTSTPTPGVGICGDTTTGQSCTYPGGTCNCVQSTQGTVDFLSQPPDVAYSESFETDADIDNMADGWIQTWVNSPHPPGSIVSYSRVSPGFHLNYSQKVTSAMFGEALYSPSFTLQPNTKYTYSAWVKLTGGNLPVNIRIVLNSGACGIHGSSSLTQLNQYTRLSVTFNTTNPQCPNNTSPTGAIIAIQPVEAVPNTSNTASYEADGVQIVKEN